MSVHLAELATRMRGQLVGADQPYSNFALDSREVSPGSVFLAIKGARVDGHDFVEMAVSLGAVACVVEKPIHGTHILVPDVVAAIGYLGQSYREEFSGPVIGVTGSNGKTTTKQLIAAALSPMGPVLMNQGNQNSEFTSPLTWTRLEPDHKSAVIEMGMRGFGQIKHLAEISRPTHAVITMIGTSHIEMVGSREGIAKAKGELFESLPAYGTAIAWADDDFVQDLKKLAPGKFVTFGFNHDADMSVVGYKALSMNLSQIRLDFHGEQCTIELPTIGRHNAQNAAAAILAAIECGVKFKEACEAIAHAELPPMRMETLTYRGAKVLLDTYNASPDSMIAALKTLLELPCEGRRLAVLGSMKELGVTLESGHRAVGKQVALSNLDALVLIGEETRYVAEEAIQDGFPAGKIIHADGMDTVTSFLQTIREGDLVLIKGSRALGLEQALPDEVLP